MIEFELTESFIMQPEEFIDNIFDESSWLDYEGYGFLPGIKNVDISNYSKDRIGTKFHLTNTDGSKHVESVIEYIPGELLVLEFSEFKKPLKNLASHFIETFHFERVGDRTNLVRTFQIFPSNVIGTVLLSVISIFLKKAIRKHLDKIVVKEKEIASE
ncbi:MAG: hypothetical protein V3V16_00530 [Melioribacteraceae bacterium]